MRKICLLLTAMFLLLLNTKAQDRTVTGKVTDDKGLPVANASVIVKGTKLGTSTNSLGIYTLNVPSSAKTLVISSIGLTSREVNISSGNFDVVMTTDVNSMVGVVVQVPYGTVKKTAFTGSENTVGAATIQKAQVTNVANVLEGYVPGITATNGGGAPGQSATAVEIRGPSSINLSSGPLFVLNGVPYTGDINAISNDDIESLTVLKDAAASSLYGSRAANGVVMITTKKGRKGKANVSVSLKQGFMSRGIPEYDRVDSKQYYELFWEAYKNSYLSQGQVLDSAKVHASNVLTSSSGLVYNAYNVPGNQLIDTATGKLNPNAKLLWNESWEDALFRTASRTNASVSISGASDNMDYYLSAGYLDEQGIVRNSDYKRYNLRLNLNIAATNWLNVGTNIDGSSARRNDVLSGGTATSNPFYYSRYMGPIYPVYQHDLVTGAFIDTLGEHKLDYGVPEQMGTRPYAGRSNLRGTLELDDNHSDIFNGNGNVFAEIKFLKNFSFKASLGINLLSEYATAYQNNQYGDAAPSAPGASDGGRSSKTQARTFSLTGNEVLTWRKTLRNKHNITAFAGHENYKFRYNYLTAGKSGFVFPNQSDLDNGATTFTPPSSYQLDHTIESYFGNVNYDYDQKYLFSASYRTDGSSRFAPDVRWGDFYSYGIGWRLTQEKFLRNVKWLSELKLRGSYGEQGNENIGLFYQYHDYYYSDGTGGYVRTDHLANENLKWEKNKATNIAIDLGLFKNRITLTAEWFNKISENLLFDQPRALSLYPFTWANAGTLRNRGYELTLGLVPVRSSNFNWKIDANITHFKNKVLKVPPTPSYEKNGVSRIGGLQNIQVGTSIYDWYVPEFAGVDASNGDALYYVDILDADSKPTGQRTVTNLWAKATKYRHGSALPKVSGGITNSFNYKGFDLSILVTFAYGGIFYDANYAGLMGRGSAGTAWSTDILDRWQKPGDVTNVPRLQVDLAGQDGPSTRWLVDGSWLNIKNITLSYTLPKTTLKMMSGLTVFVNVDNAHLFTAKKGMDPQRDFTGTADATYTPFRTVTAGCTINLK
ncbi:MAG: SusC/RagA family TonB-linked outer membrane protein [Ferruginibacter sp.]